MILVDGRPVRPGDGPLDLSDRGLLLGDGLFETLPVFGNRPFRLDAHLDRLAASAERIGLPVERDRWAATVSFLAEAADPAGGTIRLTVTRGPGPRGLKAPPAPRPTVIGSLAPWSPSLVFAPVRLATVSIRRNDRSPTATMKTLGYLDAILGLAEAEAAGAIDALFLNTADRVACTSMANLFAVFADHVATPPVAAGILPGIARALLIEAGSIAGRPVAERDLAPADLDGAEALFLTNSVRFVLPVAAVDGRDLSTSRLATAVDGRDLASTYPVAAAARDLIARAAAVECGRDPLGSPSDRPGT